MIEKLFNIFRTILINFGQYGTEQMCAGFLHEVEIPQELQNSLEKENN